jgi:hypothetical protein
MELYGVARGKPHKTTVSDKARLCPQDRVKQQFRAERPNALRPKRRVIGNSASPPRRRDSHA